MAEKIPSESRGDPSGNRDTKPAAPAAAFRIEGEVHTFIDGLPDPIWVFDRQTLRIVLANPAAGQMLGYNTDELSQLTIADLRFPEDVPALRDAVANLGEDEVSGGVWRLRSKSGAIVHADFHWKPIVHGGRASVLASIRDVTRLVALERERAALLAETEVQRNAAEAAAQQFREIVESAPGKFLVITPEDYRIVAASDAYLDATMTQRADILGRTIFDVFPDDPDDPDPEGEAALRASITRVGSKGVSDAMGILRFPIPRPAHLGDGHEERYWSIVNAPIRDASDRIALVVHRVEDMTEFVQAGRLDELADDAVRDFAVELLQRTEDLQKVNALLLEKEANLRTAQRLLDIGIWKLDIETGAMWWSENLAELCGLTSDQAPRGVDDFVALLHPEDSADAQSELQTFLANGATHVEFQHRLLLPDGRVLHMRGVGERAETRDGQMIVGVVQNVSDQIETSRELSRMNDLLQIAGSIARFGGWYVAVGSDVVEWSEQSAEIHDLSPDVIPTVAEAINYYIPEHRDRIRHLFQACIGEGVPFDEMLQIDTAAGRRIWIRTVGRPVHDGSGAIVAAQGALQDISDIVRMRDHSEELAHSLVRTLESMSDAMVTLSPDFRYTFVNSQAERLLKHKRDALIDRVIWDVFPDAIGSVVQKEFERAMATGEAVRFEYYYAEPLDTWFEVNADPSAEGLAVYFRDIGEKHRAEAALRRSEERFRMVTRATDDMIWDWDVATGAIWANERMQQVLGHGYDNAPSDIDLWKARVHPEDLGQIRHDFEQAVANGADIWQAEYRYLRADGRFATLLDRGVFLRDGDGRLVRMISSVVDATEARAAEAQLRRALRLEAVGQLTGGLAHDFNNLLTIILGNAELLAERLDQPRLQRMAQQTAQAAERGAEITSRLLSFARQQPLAPLSVDVTTLMQSIDGLLRRTVSEEIELLILADPLPGAALWHAQVDPGQLELAVLNLVINARDAMPGGGKLTIGSENVTLKAADVAAHDDVAQGDYVAITVTDTGTGMAPEVVERVVEPFFTTKPEGKGSGLGLSMVYGFVKQSGGHITIETEQGRGTSVRLLFRRADPVSGADPIDQPSALADGSEHILIVEDDPHVRDHLVDQLNSLGYRVSSAPDGARALQLLDAMTDLDLLLTDVVMPGGINGRELADRARQKQPELKILFTSGYSENTLMSRGRLDDGVELLSKPFRRQDLAAKIRKVLESA